MPDVTLHRTTTRGLLEALDELTLLTPQQQTIFAIIANRRGAIVPRSDIVEELYAGRADGGALNTRLVINGAVCQMRKLGYPIVTYHWRGLRYEPDRSGAPARRKARRAA